MGSAALALEPPGGLVYRPDFLTTGEEAELLAVVENLEPPVLDHLPHRAGADARR